MSLDIFSLFLSISKDNTSRTTNTHAVDNNIWVVLPLENIVFELENEKEIKIIITHIQNEYINLFSSTGFLKKYFLQMKDMLITTKKIENSKHIRILPGPTSNSAAVGGTMTSAKEKC